MLRSAQQSVVEVFGRLLGHEVDEVCDLVAEVPVRSCEQTKFLVGLFEQLFQFLVGWFVCVAHTFDHRHKLEDVKSCFIQLFKRTTIQLSGNPCRQLSSDPYRQLFGNNLDVSWDAPIVYGMRCINCRDDLAANSLAIFCSRCWPAKFAQAS